MEIVLIIIYGLALSFIFLYSIVQINLVINYLRNSKKDTLRKKELLQLEYLEVKKDTYKLAAEIGRKLDRKGERVALPDCLIAANAIEHSAVLVATDKHFSRFQNLKVFNS